MAGTRGGGWRGSERGEQILHFDKLKFQNVNLISEQYLPSHREVETGCWYPMALGRRRSSQAGVQPSRPKGEQPLLAER